MRLPSYDVLLKKTRVPSTYLDSYPWLGRLESIIRNTLAKESSGHDFYHHLRVLNLCLSIAGDETLDREVLLAAALLHDIARHEERVLDKPSDYHLIKGVEIAEKILKDIRFPTSKTWLVSKCLKEHEAEQSECRTVQILQDADKLDAMGAIGIARCFTYGGKISRPIWSPANGVEEWKPGVRNSSSIAHLYARILNLLDKMNTARGKRIAKARFQFMVQFMNQLYREWEGES